jgi:hypothetical protein
MRSQSCLRDPPFHLLSQLIFAKSGVYVTTLESTPPPSRNRVICNFNNKFNDMADSRTCVVEAILVPHNSE